MALNEELLRKRMKEAFGTDSQTTVAEKLNTTQGNVSKMLIGTRLPTLETAYLIAEAYGVSVDWLLGLSDRKKPSNGMSYASAIECLLLLKDSGALMLVGISDDILEAELHDPLLCALLRKAEDLSAVDWDSYFHWVETKLPLYEDRCLIHKEVWSGNGNAAELISFATTDSEYLEYHDLAKEEQKELNIHFSTTLIYGED